MKRSHHHREWFDLQRKHNADLHVILAELECQREGRHRLVDLEFARRKVIALESWGA